MNSTPIELPEEYRQNLLKLADYLSKFQETPEQQFDMSKFDATRRAYSTRPTCGSVGCAVGHGPYAGIHKLDGEDWMSYSQRVLLPVEHHNIDDAFEADAWGWCFSGRWADVDNTAAGAAKRIHWLLEHGLPYDVEDQLCDEAPLCYVPEEACPPN